MRWFMTGKQLSELRQEVRELRTEQAETNRLLREILEFAEHSSKTDDEVKHLEIRAAQRMARRSMGLAVIGIAVGVYFSLLTAGAPDWVLTGVLFAGFMSVGVFWSLPAYFKKEEGHHHLVMVYAELEREHGSKYVDDLLRGDSR
jgi:hypothetical protein